jgi:hypothetical protein
MIFITNKYTRIYYRIISNAQSRTLPDGIYVEKHHIIPKSLNGTNLKNNLVKLTAREHFICHRLLTKMLAGPDLFRMQRAVSYMSTLNIVHSRYNISSRLFEQLRIAASNAHSQLMRGKLAGPNNPMFGKTHTTASSQKMKAAAKLKDKPSSSVVKKRSDSLRGFKHTEATRINLSVAWQKKEKFTCIHCGIICPPHLHNRWHGDNCKHYTRL